MDNNYKSVETRIPIQNILSKVSFETDCEILDQSIYFICEYLLDDLNIQFNYSKKGGKSIRKTIKRKYLKKSRKFLKKSRKYLKKQKGGATHLYILLFISFILLAQGMRNMSYLDVKERINDAFHAKELFRNKYGTCSINSLLFLRSIHLDTFKDLSLQIMKTNKGLTSSQFTEYLNSEIVFKTDWLILLATGDEDPLAVDLNAVSFIDKIKSKISRLREIYGHGNLLTAMNYPVKNKKNGHAVVLWITENDELVLIDPQDFYYENRIVLYSSAPLQNNVTNMHFEPLTEYIKNRVDVLDDNRETQIFMQMHTEIDTGIKDNELTNRVVSSIQNAMPKSKHNWNTFTGKYTKKHF